MRSPKTVAALLAAAALLVPAPAQAWGGLGHRTIQSHAIATLPPHLRPLFEGNAAYLIEHSIDPDLWRDAGDEAEAPNHYLDFEDFGAYPFPDVLHDEAEHLRRHGAEARKLGRLPWRVAEVYGELVEAFRAGDEPRALERAAVLGHYVADSFVPLHATSNHDGQHTAQPGVHSRWESRLVERFQQQIVAALQPAPAVRVDDPLETMFDVLLASNRNVAGLLESDRQAAGTVDFAETSDDDRYDAGYYSRLWAREGDRVTSQMAGAASLLGSLWLSAWEHAGRPELDPSFRVAYVRGARRAILASLDGGGAALVDDAVSRGVMPALARLRAAGMTPAGSVGTLPVKTAAAHAALFTGAWSDVNGIAGNDVPVPDGTVLQAADGFDSRRLRVEPVWVSAARQGLDVTVAQATHIAPFDPYRRGGAFGDADRRLNLIDGYGDRREGPHAWRAVDLELRDAAPGLELPPHEGPVRAFNLNILGNRVEGVLIDDPSDPVAGFDTLVLGEGRDLREGIRLKPAPAGDVEAFGALELRAGPAETAGVFFRLFELSPDGSRLLLYRAGVHVIQADRPELKAAAQKATGGFVGGGAWDVYEKGGLGPTLWQGGDGLAERRYVETLAQCTRQMARLVEFAARTTRWQLLVSYLPHPDEAMHQWSGRLDPSLPSHDPQVAARLHEFADDVLRVVDSYVATLSAIAGDDTILAVVADHGHIGVDRAVRPNVALRQAGLLALAGDRQVDLARTRAVYFPGNAAHVLVNRVGRPQGIVTAESEADVRRSVRETLLAIRDPETGAAPVLDVFDPKGHCVTAAAPEVDAERVCPGAGPPTGGDLYLSLRPGYTLSSSLSGDVVERTAVRGDHFTNPERRPLHSMVVFTGPGVAPGRTGLIRHVDVTPTLLALLGAEPPPQADGAVLGSVLASPPAPRRAETSGR